MKARVLVTGGAGFIGSNIAAELVRRGERVRILDNFATGKRENIAPFLSRVELIEEDLRRPVSTETGCNRATSPRW
ncbi:MAG: NAD-dependent epimerase/dehydratase family protein [Anaerolineae bacterium]